MQTYNYLLLVQVAMRPQHHAVRVESVEPPDPVIQARPGGRGHGHMVGG